MPCVQEEAKMLNNQKLPVVLALFENWYHTALSAVLGLKRGWTRIQNVLVFILKMACAFASPYSSENYRKIDLNHYSTVCHYYTEVRNCNCYIAGVCSRYSAPWISMFPSTSSRETLRFSGNKIHCSPRDQSLSVYYLSPLQLSSSLVLIQNGGCVIRMYEKPTLHPLLVLSVFKSSAKEVRKIKEDIGSI